MLVWRSLFVRKGMREKWSGGWAWRCRGCESYWRGGGEWWRGAEKWPSGHWIRFCYRWDKCPIVRVYVMIEC